MDKQISHNVSETCKKLGIPYKSCNPNYVEFTNDAQELVQIDEDLKTIVDKLNMLEERHKIDGLAEPLEKAIIELGKIDHEILRLSRRIKENDK